MLKLLIIASLIAFSLQTSCIPVKCIDDEKETKCLIKSDTEIKVKSCGAGKTCSETNGCQVEKKVAGLACELNTDCHSGLCENKVRVGKKEGEKCGKSFECANNLYCGTDEKCKKFKVEGDDCDLSDSNCGFGLSCNYEQGQMKGKCAKVLSLEVGTYSMNPVLCKTKYTINNICASSTAVEEEGKECTQDSDCKMKFKTGEKEEEGNGTCECNLASAKGMCKYSTAYEPYNSYITAYKNYYTSTLKETIYTGMAILVPNSEVRKAEASAVVDYKGASQCVIDYYLASYDASYFIKVSFLTLLSVFLF